jgi:hypothetical protein
VEHCQKPWRSTHNGPHKMGKRETEAEAEAKKKSMHAFMHVCQCPWTNDGIDNHTMTNKVSE